MHRRVIAGLAFLVAATLAAAGVAGATVATSASILRHASFQTPTHNIGCQLLGGVARCDIRHRTYTLPPRPRSCSHIVAFGQGVLVGKSGKARIVCAGDTVLNPDLPVLAYGSSDTFGRFTCKSASVGLTCTNQITGHGFFLSIQSYRLF
jgi:hypothetical protein